MVWVCECLDMKIWLCSVKMGAEQEMMLLSAKQNMIMRAHYGDWGLGCFQVSQLSDKASDRTCLIFNHTQSSKLGIEMCRFDKMLTFLIPSTNMTIRHVTTGAV